MRSRSARAVGAAALSVLLLSDCAGGGRLPMPTPVPEAFPPANVIQIDWQGRNIRLIQVRTSADSVTGVPVGSASGCSPECRVALPRAALTGAVRWAKQGSESKTVMSTLMLIPLAFVTALIIVFSGYHD